MTGHQQRHAIARAGARDRRARGAGRSARDLGVRPGLAARNGAQLLPHTMLERGRLHVEGQVFPGPEPAS